MKVCDAYVVNSTHVHEQIIVCCNSTHVAPPTCARIHPRYTAIRIYIIEVGVGHQKMETTSLCFFVFHYTRWEQSDREASSTTLSRVGFAKEQRRGKER